MLTHYRAGKSPVKRNVMETESKKDLNEHQQQQQQPAQMKITHLQTQQVVAHDLSSGNVTASQTNAISQQGAPPPTVLSSAPHAQMLAPNRMQQPPPAPPSRHAQTGLNSCGYPASPAMASLYPPLSPFTMYAASGPATYWSSGAVLGPPPPPQ